MHYIWFCILLCSLSFNSRAFAYALKYIVIFKAKFQRIL